MVDESLRELIPRDTNVPESLQQAMTYSLFGGGKRFRPVLTLLAAESVGGSADEVLQLACAIELIHTYSLIHDDLPSVDNDDLRRNRPTCHIRFGEAVAIMAGDALFAEAFWLISHRQKGAATDINWVVRELSEATGMRGMVGGQVRDIESSCRRSDKELLRYIHEHKTGSLISAAARCGAKLGGATETQMAAVGRYAAELGLAFQVVDDILDVIGQPGLTGKNIGADESLEKLTFPAVYGLERSRALAAEAVSRAKAGLDEVELETAALRQLADFVLERDS